MGQTVLILGATGRFGRNAAEAFAKADWTVRKFNRKTDNLETAAAGADVIVNAWNPTYDKWAAEVPTLHAQVRRVAKATGATVIIPGNVYVFGPDNPPVWGEDTPHNATNPLGRIRIEMEQAYRREGVRTIVLRAGDFIDTQATGNWFDMIMIKNLKKDVFTYPGAPDVPHAWAYLPDLAAATVALAEIRDDLPKFADIPFRGYTLSGRELHAALKRVTGRSIRLRKMSWLPLQLSRPFWKMARHLLEMRYLWSLPHELNGAQFDKLWPEFETTPLDQAIRQAIQHQR